MVPGAKISGSKMKPGFIGALWRIGTNLERIANALERHAPEVPQDGRDDSACMYVDDIRAVKREIILDEFRETHGQIVQWEDLPKEWRERENG